MNLTTSQHVALLIYKVLHSVANQSEEQELETWLDQDPVNRTWFQQFRNRDWLNQQLSLYDSIDEDQALATVWEKIEQNEKQNEPTRNYFTVTKLVAAAAILILIIGATWYLYNKKPAQQAVVATTTSDPKPIVASSNNIVLTLENGQQLILDSTQKGVTLANGQLTYHSYDTNINNTVAWRTLSTPAGKQCKLQLTDGSLLSLNANSSVRFPLNDTTTERHVSVTGEVYFSIQHDPVRPFVATVKNAAITATGTRFNIKAYTADDTILVTLLEGKLQASNGTQTLQLAPLQQAQFTNNGPMRLIEHVDTSQVNGWTRELFVFKYAPLSAIIRELSHWYNVPITADYEPADKIYFVMPRKKSLEEALAYLMKDCHGAYTRKGNTITISRK